MHFQESGGLFHVGHRLLEQSQSEKEKTETDEGFSPVLGSTLADENEREADPDNGKGYRRKTEFATAAMIQAVMVVPRLAPMMTPMDSTGVRSPTLTNDTTITVDREPRGSRLPLLPPDSAW